MTIPLQNGIIYGPVKSRRFGRSLGINLLPSAYKICTFDCLYCQYGETSSAVPSFPSLDLIDKEVDDFFSDVHAQDMLIDWVTIAGNGEPTIHPQFDEAIDIILRNRDRHLYKVPVGILSNSSTCHRPEIRRSLLKLDGRFMKLDAGNLAVFNRVNRPSAVEDYDQMIRGLRLLKPLVIQSMFIAGRIDNTREEDVNLWIEKIESIRPEAVQIYSIERSTRDTGILVVPKDKLEWVASRLKEKTGISSQVFS